MSAPDMKTNLALCRLFGVDPDMAIGFTVRVRVNRLATVHIHKYVDAPRKGGTVHQRFTLSLIENPS